MIATGSWLRGTGVITGIYRYPVKSMAGEELDVAKLTLQGFEGDRQYAFVQSASRSLFPWLTGRQVPAMLGYHAACGEESKVTVRDPSGATYPVDSDDLRTQMEKSLGGAVHLVGNYRGNFDVAPVSLMSLATVRAIADASGVEYDPLRYRMNLYFDDAEAPFEEDKWVGKVLRIGTARVAITERDPRCVMITLDHSTSAGSPKVLRALAEMNGATAGVYGVVLQAGEVRVGDTIEQEPD